MKTVSLLLTTLASADNNFGNTPKPGLCPEGIPENSDCGGAYYEKLNERQISINNTAALQVEFRDKTIPILSWAYGSGTQLDEAYTNRIYVHFTEFGGCGYLAFFCGGYEPEIDDAKFDDYVDYGDDPYLNYQVAETDYDNYSLVISCHNVIVDGIDMHVEVVYLLTRTRTWGPENPVKVQELLSIPANLGLEIDNMLETKQTDCEKYDLP